MREPVAAAHMPKFSYTRLIEGVEIVDAAINVDSACPIPEGVALLQVCGRDWYDHFGGLLGRQHVATCREGWWRSLQGPSQGIFTHARPNPEFEIVGRGTSEILDADLSLPEIWKVDVYDFTPADEYVGAQLPSGGIFEISNQIAGATSAIFQAPTCSSSCINSSVRFMCSEEKSD